MKFKLLFALLLISLFACKDPIPVDEGPIFDFQKGEGFFIANEGAFGKANASVSYFDQIRDTLYQSIFEEANGEILGDVLQSMTIIDNRAYLVVSNSAYIKVVDINTFEEIASIEGFQSPRYLEAINNSEAYVSDLYAGKIWVVDLQTNEIKDSIETNVWTEEMVMVGDRVYVSSPSSWGAPQSNSVYVIDTKDHKMMDTISVKFNPNNIVLDKNGKLQIFCWGDAEAMPAQSPSIYTIDPADHDNKRFVYLIGIPQAFHSRMISNIEKDQLWLLYGAIYNADIFEDGIAYVSVPTVETEGRSLYGLSMDPLSGNLFVTDAKDYNQNGTVYEYKTNGILVNTIEVGIVPSQLVWY